MSAYPDPFADSNPWDDGSSSSSQNSPETPMPAPNSPAPYVIGFTLKSGSGYDAEWITPKVYGHTAEETAQRGAELLAAMKTAGLIDLTAKAAQYTRDQHMGGSSQAGGAAPKRFQGGKVVSQAPAAAAAAPEDDSCTHGRTLREGQGKNGAWGALFCSAPKGSQCDPLWRQKDGTFK